MDDAAAAESSGVPETVAEPSPAGDAESTSRLRVFHRRLQDDADYQLEVISAILLAITTVLTAWSAYQSTRWGGVQAAEYSRAASTRVQATKEFSLGTEKYTLDTNTFNQYAAAYATGNNQLASFYKNRVIRPEFVPYLDTWIATNPLDPAQQGNVLRSPLEDPAYLDALFSKSTELEAQAADHFQQAQDANQTGDEYVLATVFFASVLFFGGISSKFRSKQVRIALLVAGGIMLVFGLARLIGLPIE